MESFILREQIDSKICDKLIAEFKSKESNASFDKKREYWRINDWNLDKELVKEYEKELINVENKYRQKFKWINEGTKWGLMSPYNFQKYNPGHAYNPVHIEEGGPKDNKYQRILAFMTYLNDVEFGGETEFIHQNVKIKPRKGLTLIWPAGWTHPHKGIPANNETKYIVTGWFSYHWKGEDTNKRKKSTIWQ